MTQRKKPRWLWREAWLFVTPLLIFVLLFGASQGREWWQRRQEQLKREAQVAHVAQQQSDLQEQKRRASQSELAKALLLHKVLWSPDGQTLVSMSRDSIAVWDAVAGRLKQPLLHEHWRDIAFSPDGKKLAAVVGKSSQKPQLHHYDWVIQIWSVSKQGLHPTHRFTAHEMDAPLCLIFSPDSSRLLVGGGGEIYSQKLLAKSLSRGITIYDATTGKIDQRLVPPTHFDYGPSGVSAIAASSGNKTIVMGQQNGQFSTWHLSGGKLISAVRPYMSGIGSLEFSPDEKTLAVASNGDEKGFWNANSHRPVEVHKFHQFGGVMHYSPDGRTTIIAGGDDAFYDPPYRFIILVPVDGTGVGRFLLEGTQKDQGRGDANDARFSPDGTRIASAHDNGVIKIWDVKTGKVLITLHHPL